MSQKSKNINTSHSKRGIHGNKETEHDTHTHQIPTSTEETVETSKIEDANQSELMSIINEVIEEGI